MNIGATLIANTKATHLTEPGQCPLHHPAVTAQALACVSTSTSNAQLDASPPERRTAFPEVISLVGMHLVRTLAGPPRGCLIRGIASISASKTIESCRLAAVIITASGVPRRSTTRWRFVPALPRSARTHQASGFDPVCAPCIFQKTFRVSVAPCAPQVL